MKLATSTGDFSWYTNSVSEEIRSFKDSKFRYINLEQPGSLPAYFAESDDDWKRLADEWGNAAADAGVTFVVSHAPCLRMPGSNHLQPADEETYRVNLRAFRRSIEICHVLNIDRIVVHACPNGNKEEFYKYNYRFYRDMFDLMEKHQISVLTENFDYPGLHLSTGDDLREFIEYVDHPLLAACWDTAHGNMNSETRKISQYQNIIAIGDQLKGLHISDNFGDCHHHSWPFAGIINFDSVMQGLVDVNYDGYFTFEASYTLLHHKNIPYHREPWEHNGQIVTKLLDPSIELKKSAVELLYETGKYMLEAYNCFSE